MPTATLGTHRAIPSFSRKLSSLIRRPWANTPHSGLSEKIEIPVSSRPKNENDSAPLVFSPLSTENPGDAFAP
jgi:hypothetical protein